MKYFDVTLPTLGEENPKIHKVDQETFKKALVDFPRALAERMVELGYGRWIPITATVKVPVPQAFVFPEQILFINSPTRSVKACHVNAIVPDVGPVPDSLELFCENIKEDIKFQHSPEDLEGLTFNEEDTLADLLDELDFVEGVDEPITEPDEPETKEKKEPALPKNRVKEEKAKKEEAVNKGKDVPEATNPVEQSPTEEKK